MFEALIQRLFEYAHFRVTRNAGAARPRQTDLVASHGNEDFLIEAKWQNDRVDIDDLDSLRSRLGRTASHVVGIFVSISGFTKTAIEGVGSDRTRIILLIDGSEIDDLFREPASLLALLRFKRERLIVDGQVLLSDSRRRRSGPAPDRLVLPAPNMQIALPSGGTAGWIAGGGEFGRAVFVQELPDVTWASTHGTGVGFDLHIYASNREDIARVIEILRRMGWVSSAGRFAIQQSTTAWYGLGAAAFLDALDAWGERYATAVGTMHHTEEATYFDKWEDGFYTLTMGVQAGDDRVWGVNFSARLPGVPLVTEPFYDLALALDTDTHTYFIPLLQGDNRHIHPTQRHVPLEAVALLRDPSEEWVTGIVARNPFRGSTPPSFEDVGEREELDQLRHIEFLICELSSWHHLDSPVGGYYLRRLHIGETSDATLIEVSADWDDPDPPRDLDGRGSQFQESVA